nr:immunoglobulin heavy chain junction region [Macaca mulatta]
CARYYGSGYYWYIDYW